MSHASWAFLLLLSFCFKGNFSLVLTFYDHFSLFALSHQSICISLLTWSHLLLRHCLSALIIADP